MDSPVYAVYDEGLEQNGAVVGFTGEFVDHSSGGDNVRSRGVRARGGRREGGEGRLEWWGIYCEDMMLGGEKRARGSGRARRLYRNFEIPRFCCDSKTVITSERSPSHSHSINKTQHPQ